MLQIRVKKIEVTAHEYDSIEHIDVEIKCNEEASLSEIQMLLGTMSFSSDRVTLARSCGVIMTITWNQLYIIKRRLPHADVKYAKLLNVNSINRYTNNMYSIQFNMSKDLPQEYADYFIGSCAYGSNLYEYIAKHINC